MRKKCKKGGPSGKTWKSVHLHAQQQSARHNLDGATHPGRQILKKLLEKARRATSLANIALLDRIAVSAHVPYLRCPSQGPRLYTHKQLCNESFISGVLSLRLLV